MRKTTRKRKQKLLIAVGIIMFSILVVIGAVYFVFRGKVTSTAENEIYPNIYIESVDVSGMKQAEAKQAVEAKIKEYQQQNITFRVEEGTVQAALSELGFTMKDVDQLVEKALSYGKDGSIWNRYFQVKKLDKEKKLFEVEYQIDSEKTKKVLEEKAQPLEKAAANATITRENGAFVITDEVEGKKIDTEASMKMIEEYLNKKWDKKEAVLELAVVSDVPNITREQLGTIQDTLGTFTTYCGKGGGKVGRI